MIWYTTLTVIKSETSRTRLLLPSFPAVPFIQTFHLVLDVLCRPVLIPMLHEEVAAEIHAWLYPLEDVLWKRSANVQFFIR